MKSRAYMFCVGAALTFAAFALVASGCTPPGNTGDAGPDDGGGLAFQCPNKSDGTDVLECKRAFDCGGGSLCVKENEDDEYGCCVPVLCRSDADCDESEKCDLFRQICVPKNLCDPGNPGDVCQDNEYCIYVEGTPQCVTADELPNPTACNIAPAAIYAPHGATVEVRATGEANGKLVPHAEFTFSASMTAGGAIVNGNAITLTCEAASACTGTITATSTRGSASCNAGVTVYPAVANGDFRAVVFNQETGAPIPGATVALRVGGNLQTGTTGADGSYTFTNVGTGPFEAISAFHDDYQWQTVLAPQGNDIALYTVPVPDLTKVAGVKGKFDYANVSTTGDIKLGLAGLSISSAITDLDFAQLLGAVAGYNIKLEGVTDADGENVCLPSGLLLELASEELKGDFVTFGDEGKRILWALGGRVRLSEIGEIISNVTATDDLNAGQILGAVLPFFARFDHAVVTGLNLTSAPKPAAFEADLGFGECADDPTAHPPVPYEDWTNLVNLDGANAVKPNTLLSRSADYTVPLLPCAPGATATSGCNNNAFVSGAVLLTGVIVPGQGIVPLGITAGLDDPDDKDANDQVDGQLDWAGDNENAPEKGHANVYYAPPHDGLEGNLYVTVAIALDIDGLTEGSLAASTITHVSDRLTTANRFPVADGFLEHQGGTFSSANGTFTMTAVGYADFYRVNLDDGDAEWNIWFADRNATINLNDLRPANVTGRDKTLDVQAFRFGTGYAGNAPTSFDELMKFNGTNLDNLLYYMGAWSSTACATDGFCNKVD